MTFAHQVRPYLILFLALLLGSCTRPAGDTTPVGEAQSANDGREKLLSTMQGAVRLEYTIFWHEADETKSRLGPIIVDSAEDVGRLRVLLAGSLDEVQRNSRPFNEIMLRYGEATYITTVAANLQTERLRLQVGRYLEFFHDEGWTTKLTNGSFDEELLRIAIERSQENPRLIMKVEPVRVLSGENSD